MKAARIKAGKTQVQCAAEMSILAPGKVSQRQWWRLENDLDLGSRHFVTVWMIAYVLGVEPWEIVTEAHRQTMLDRMKGRKP